MQTYISSNVVGPAVDINERIEIYRSIEKWASWLAMWMVYWANHKPKNEGRKPKVGAHQASTASATSILTALYLDILRPQDRIAVKPHASPFLYAILYLMNRLTRSQVENLREFGGLQPYPTQHFNPDLIDYSTSVEGLGPCAVIEDAYEAFVQRDQLGRQIDSIYHAVVGDGELTELQIGGSLYEAGRRRLGNLRWWIDLNRQSLDRVMEDSPCGRTADWARNLFEANGWNVIDLHWGSRIESDFGSAAGEEFRARLESLGDAQYQSLLLLDGATVRKALIGNTEDRVVHIEDFLNRFCARAPIGHGVSVKLAAFLSQYSEPELKGLVEDLGGHDLEKLILAGKRADTVTDRPTAILCHTIKGWRMPRWAGHPENHGAVMTREQMDGYRQLLGLPEGDPFARLSQDSAEARLVEQRASELFPEAKHKLMAFRREVLPQWEQVRIPFVGERSTSSAFGTLNKIYVLLPIGHYMAFVAPDVGLTTHLGSVIATTGVYGHDPGPDLFRFLRDQQNSMFQWRLSREGRFHSIAINEGVAALLLYAFGRQKFEIEGKEQMFAVGTIYDAFWKHAYSQLYYALYDGARFLAVGTPSGTSLSWESGTHQSIQTPAIIMGLPNIIYYEPAYSFDVNVIYEWALRQMTEPQGEAVYIRLSTQELLQPWGAPSKKLLEAHGLAWLPSFSEDEETTERLREQVILGGYWLVDNRQESHYDPRCNAALIFATGPVMEEALRASQRLLQEHSIYANVCNITSWERLKRDYERYWAAAESWEDDGASYHLNDLIMDDELMAPAVIVGDFSPQVAEWVGSALGRHVQVLGPTRFSQAGDLESIRRHHRIDSESIMNTILKEFGIKQIFHKSKPSRGDSFPRSIGY